jgi:hypothetical protein
MANINCITIETANKLKELAKKGQINIAKMYEMTSEQRRTLFEQVVDKDTAIFVNTKFEEAMISENQNALKKWAESTFNTREKKSEGYKDIIKKIDNLREMGILDPKSTDAFLEDLVASKLGVTVTADEAKTINEKSKKLEELYVEGLGNPNVNPKGQREYFKARRDIEDYLDSLTPSSKLRVVTSTISRGNMLWRLPSILVNINSNNIEGTIATVVRRFAERTIKADNAGEIGKYVKFNANIFLETGFDLSRMQTIESDRKILGEEIGTSQGKGLIRKVGRFYEDVIFNMTQGMPDVIASSIAFSDRATLTATKIARHEGLKGVDAKKRALFLTNDSMLVNPTTLEGEEIRKIAMIDAQRSTNTDTRILAKKTLAFRKLLNVGDFRFGDMQIPFVKTTANAIQSSLETSGITIPIKVIINAIKMVKLVRGGDGWGEASRESFTNFGDTMVRAGLGVFGAWLIANAINKEDYVGIYPTTLKEQELLRMKNAVANSIRIGGKYWSLDWFGALAAPLIGFLNAKKYGYDIPSSAYFYGSGVTYQILKTPGLDYIRQSLDSLQKFLTSTKSTVPSDVSKQIANYMVDFVKSRFVPGFAQSLAELTDNVVRDASTKNDILAPIKSMIPGLRQTLPEKRTVFGETIATEGWNTLIFGGRQKTAVDNNIIKELNRLSDTGLLPALYDIEKKSQRARDLKIQIGNEKFSKAKELYGKRLKIAVNGLIRSTKYIKAEDDEKKDMIDKVNSVEFERMLKIAGYRPLKKK